MAKYIDREALVEWLKRVPLKDLSDGLGLCRVIMEDDFKKAIRKMPKGIIADAVEVVWCKDCKHWKPSGSKAGNSFSDMEYIGGCEFSNYYRRESDFCSYGERKEGDGNG